MNHPASDDGLAPGWRVRAVDLAKQWDEHSGLQPVSFSVDAGELVVVRGRSGSGKSTLLALVAGWCAPDGGSVEVRADAGVAVDSWAAVAVVPQVLALVPELTVAENVAEAFGAEARSMAASAAVDAVLRALALDDLRDRLPGDTSMGQRQRTAVARAIVAPSTVVLVDEPTSHQDPVNAALVIDALRTSAQAGRAVLAASHDEAVVAAADRVVDLSA